MKTFMLISQNMNVNVDVDDLISLFLYDNQLTDSLQTAAA